MTNAAVLRPIVTTPPWFYFLLGRSYGLVNGFIQIVFPYIAIRHGLSLTAIASVISVFVLASPLKLFWTPVLDLVGTLRGWVLLGSLLAMVLVMALTLSISGQGQLPLGLLLVLAFSASTAAQIASSATQGLLVLTVPHARLGEAASFLQAGDLTMQGLGGGLGLLVATHLGLPATALCFALMIVPTVPLLLWVTEPDRVVQSVSIARRALGLGREMVEMARQPRRRWVMIAFLTPIGAGSASYLWSAIAPEWHANADQVAIVNGIGAAMVSALGCLVYGRFFDRFDRSLSYLWTAVALVAAAILLVVLPRSPLGFIVGTMIYSLLLGCAWTSYGALQYETVGGGAATTKNALLNAFGNAPNTYMPVLLGLVHDRWSASAMLLFEAGLTAAFIILFWLVRPNERPIANSAVALPA